MPNESSLIQYLLSALLGGGDQFLNEYTGSLYPRGASASAGGNFVPFEDIYPGGVPPESPPGSMFGGISPAEAARTLTTFHGGGTLPPSGPAPVSAPSYDPRMFHPHSQQPYIPGKTTNVVPMGGQYGGMEEAAPQPAAASGPLPVVRITSQPLSQTAIDVYRQNQIREEAMRRMLAESQQPYIRGKTTNVVPMDYSR